MLQLKNTEEGISWETVRGGQLIPPKKTAKKKSNPERIIQDDCLKFLKEKGWLPIRFNSSMIISNESGIPIRSYLIYGLGMSSGLSDIIAFKDDRYLMIEVKAEKGKLNENQLKFQKHCIENGLKYFVVHSVAELNDLLNSINELFLRG
jgi:hypothetical protein